MLARIRKSMKDKDQGFTLIELLVVMIIIGILAAIAIPVFLSQRKKAQDSATKSDVSTIGKELASYYVDGAGGSEGPQSVTIDATTRQITIGFTAAASNITLGKASKGVAVDASTTATRLSNSSAWCVALTNPGGSTTTWKYSALGGLASGACS
jgi:type IV pilus assembly protein PilA